MIFSISIPGPMYDFSMISAPSLDIPKKPWHGKEEVALPPPARMSYGAVLLCRKFTTKKSAADNSLRLIFVPQALNMSTVVGEFHGQQIVRSMPSLQIKKWKLHKRNGVVGMFCSTLRVLKKHPSKSRKSGGSWMYPDPTMGNPYRIALYRKSQPPISNRFETPP